MTSSDNKQRHHLRNTRRFNRGDRPPRGRKHRRLSRKTPSQRVGLISSRQSSHYAQFRSPKFYFWLSVLLFRVSNTRAVGLVRSETGRHIYPCWQYPATEQRKGSSLYAQLQLWWCFDDKSEINGNSEARQDSLALHMPTWERVIVNVNVMLLVTLGYSSQMFTKGDTSRNASFPPAFGADMGLWVNLHSC